MKRFSKKRKTNISALQLLTKHEQMLTDECMHHAQELSSICQKLDHNWEQTVFDEASFIIDVSKGREALLSIIANLEKHNSVKNSLKVGSHYQISSIFLKDCWEYLGSDPLKKERLHLVTGTITSDGTRILSRMEKLKYGKQSAAYVSADDVDSHRKIISLAEEHGHLLLAMFHSHTSRGADATYPSSIDRAFLERMVKLGCDCIGGIFSLDGFVRFFSLRKDFEIEVYGKGVKKIQNTPFHRVFEIINKGKHNEDKGV